MKKWTSICLICFVLFGLRARGQITSDPATWENNPCTTGVLGVDSKPNFWIEYGPLGEVTFNDYGLCIEWSATCFRSWFPFTGCCCWVGVDLDKWENGHWVHVDYKARVWVIRCLCPPENGIPIPERTFASAPQTNNQPGLYRWGYYIIQHIGEEANFCSENSLDKPFVTTEHLEDASVRWWEDGPGLLGPAGTQQAWVMSVPLPTPPATLPLLSGIDLTTNPPTILPPPGTPVGPVDPAPVLPPAIQLLPLPYNQLPYGPPLIYSPPDGRP